MDVVFEVKGHGKSEKVKKGDVVIEYKVKLVSMDGRCTLTLSDSDRSIVDQYPLSGDVAVKIGKCNQTTLSTGKDEEEE
jgi:hypothetical protein